jgi:hypothetical protein
MRYIKYARKVFLYLSFLYLASFKIRIIIILLICNNLIYIQSARLLRIISSIRFDESSKLAAECCRWKG